MTENNLTQKTLKTPEIIEVCSSLTEQLDETSMEWSNTQLVEIVQKADVLQIRTISQLQDMTNVHDENGNTLAHVAARYATPEMIEELKNQGVPLNQPNKAGEKPIHIATRHGKMANIDKLIELGVSINEPTEKTLKTPIHIAARYLGVEELRQLVLLGADVNTKTKWGHTPFFSATANNNFENTMELLQMGNDINEQDLEGNTALFYVAALGHTEMAELLCSRGANITLPNKNGISATEMAEEENHVEIALMLRTFVLRNFLNNKLDKIEQQIDMLINLVQDYSNEELMNKVGVMNFARIRYSQFRATTRLTEMVNFTQKVVYIDQCNQRQNQPTGFAQLNEALRLSLTNASLSPAAFAAATEQLLLCPQKVSDNLKNMRTLSDKIKISLSVIPDSLINATMHTHNNYPLYSISRAYARLNEIVKFTSDLQKEQTNQSTNENTPSPVLIAKDSSLKGIIQQKQTDIHQK